jgi:oligosaccharide repeat unit polymerase
MSASSVLSTGPDIHLPGPYLGRAWKPVWSLAIFGLCAVVILGGSSYLISNILILACIFFLILGVVAATRNNDVGFAHPIIIFAIGFIQYYLLPPLTQTLLGDKISLATKVFGQLTSSEDGVLAYTIGISLLGLIFFFVGYFSSVWRLFRRWRIFLIGRRWSRRSVVLVTSASIGVCIAGLAIFFSIVGWSVYLDTPRELRHFLYERAPAAGFLVDFSGTALVLMSALIMERHRGHPLKTWILIAFMLIPYAIFHQAIFSGSRIQIVRVLAILLIYWHLRIGRLNIRRLLLYGVCLITLVVVLGVARSGVGNEDFELVPELERLVASWDTFLTILVYAMDFPTTYDIFLMMTNHRPDFDFGYGISYAKLFLSVIPRDLWAEKPETISWVATQIFRPEMQEIGVSYNPTILGEMYYNFGIVGIAAGSLLFGLACRMLYYFLQNNIRYVGGGIIYAALLFSILEQFRGAFSNITTHYIVFYVIPVVLVSVLARNPGTHAVPMASSVVSPK